MSQAVELSPTPPAQPALSRRTVLALLVAAALHVILLALPVSLHQDRPPRQAPIHITIAQPPKPAEAPVTEAPIETETPPLEDEPPAEEVETIDIPPPSDTAKEDPKAETKPTAPENTPPATSTAEATEQPEELTAPEDGAKSRSTVFDPGLAKKLVRERNKVRKFKSEDAEYRTTTGTFVQRGDRCWEVKQLISGDTSSESSQWLRAKCPKTSRSKSDIDRLARKYGIP